MKQFIFISVTLLFVGVMSSFESKKEVSLPDCDEECLTAISPSGQTLTICRTCCYSDTTPVRLLGCGEPQTLPPDPDGSMKQLFAIVNKPIDSEESRNEMIKDIEENGYKLEDSSSIPKK